MRFWHIAVFVFALNISIAFMDSAGLFNSKLYTPSASTNTWSDDISDQRLLNYSSAGTSEERGLVGDIEFGVGIFNTFTKAYDVLPALIVNIGGSALQPIANGIELMIIFIYAGAIVQIVARTFGGAE